MNILSFIIKNRFLIAVSLFAAILLLLLKQCSNVKELKARVEAEKKEKRRIENNYLAQLDTIVQEYDSKSKTLTAKIRGYEITQEELKTKYSHIFSEYLKEKNSPPKVVFQERIVIRERIVPSSVKSEIDSNGRGRFTFYDDTVFSEGNSRKVAGAIFFNVNAFSKKDSSLRNYKSLPYYLVHSSVASFFDLEQKMTLYTGLNKNDETGEVKIWAKTSYPGVTFEVLQGASVEDRIKTAETLNSLKKRWGFGFSTGLGAVYNPINSSFHPGVFFGVGLNYTPKKMQFGR